MHVAVFVASDSPLTPAILQAARACLGPACETDFNWLDNGKAAELRCPVRPTAERLDQAKTMLTAHRIDLFIVPEQDRRKKLLIADMDSTIVTGEMLDELAAHAGLQDRISAITERAMNGELDFPAALRERVLLLKGLDKSALAATLERAVLSPGATTLVRTMAAHGAQCVLVSGGFTFFTESIAARAGFHAHHGNSLVIESDALTGQVGNPILDKHSKRDFLLRYRNEHGLQQNDTLALGDGANDIPMLQEAGLGIGYHPKALVRETIENCILYGDLTAALYAQGYDQSEMQRTS